MPSRVPHLVVVGHGAAGLSAALSAAECARSLDMPLAVTLIDKAPADEAGGNTRWTPAYMRMAAPDRVEDSFVDDMLAATGDRGERCYFERLAQDAPATVQWIASHGVRFHQPVYYLAKGPPRIQPVGGGAAIHRELTLACERAGVSLRYGCAALALERNDQGCPAGLRLATGEVLPADAVILASGGFQANAAMMREHFGPGGESIPLLAPRASFNTGDGIRIANEQGADLSGEWRGMHSEPVDPRSTNQAPVVLVYPYGIVVDKNGRRFFDEGAGLVHETWERFSRDIHFSAPGREVYAILDRRLFDIADWQRATRSEAPPVQAGTLEGLSRALGIDAVNLARTVADYNDAATGDASRFDAGRCDGLAAGPSLVPPKSNWARPISEPPFVGYPLVGAIAYTFGGIATDASARVLRGGAPLPGLYAAGEITGHFYVTAPNAVSVLRALVFGRIAGQTAVGDLRLRPR
jgi:tricarballylate dehydrogenase